MSSNRDAMLDGAAGYATALRGLQEAGLPAAFTQTGGGSFALEARLEGGSTLLITEADDCLAWPPGEHRSWGVGLYARTSEYDGGPERFIDTDDASTEGLLAAVAALLLQEPSTLNDQCVRRSTAKLSSLQSGSRSGR